MESEASVYNPLELMLIDESAEPAALSLSLLKSITNNFSDDLQIGSGGFAVVYKGKLENGAVAVKKLSLTQEVHETKFCQEVDSLMRVKHKNIVRFMGYCSDTQGKVWKLPEKNVMAEERQRFLCFEFLPQGSLDKHISDATHGLEWMERYRIIKGICEGLHYLHHGDQNKIVHCDLKPANILLDHDMNPKIIDFGLSRLFDEKQTRAMTSTVIGSMGYMAPEYIDGQITLKSDIYSLGIIILEILTGQKGYTKIENVLESWNTVSLEDTWLESVRVCAEIGIECIESNPDNRPDMKRIIERLTEMEHTYGFTFPQINAYDKVKLQIMGRVKWIPLTKNAEDFPVLVRVRAPRKCTESSRVGLDLVAVLGISRSMMLLENRMDSMKEAMMFVIDNLGPDDRLSVVSFNDKTRRLTELSIMTDVNRERARHEVCMLVPRGGNNMGPALNEAAKILQQRGPEERSNRVGRIILLSDYKDRSFKLSDICREFPVDTFGLGIEHEFDDLSQIAERTKGLYSYVYQDLEKIKDALAQSLGGLMSVAAMDVEISLQTLDGINISSIESGSYSMQISSNNRSAIIKLPDLYAGEKKNFIVHLTVPVGEQNRLMNISGSYWNCKISKEARIQLDDSELAVLRSRRAYPSDKSVHPHVAKELVRRWLWCQLNQLNSMKYKGHLNFKDFEDSWIELLDSEDGENAPESMVLALEKDLAEIRRGDGVSFMFLLSWLSSHSLQRSTTKESPSKSSAFRVEAMEEMLIKSDAEPKRLTESSGSEEKVKLEIMPGINSISSTTGANEFPVLVRVTAPLRCTKRSRAELDLVAVLHVGSNMLDFVKQAMMFVINTLDPNDRLSVVSFNGETQRLTELSFMTDVNREIARREVCMLVPGGGTNTGLALNEAAKILRHRGLEELIMNRVGRVIFISDGADQSISEYEMLPEDVTVDTFGLGADHDLKILSDIAMKTMGVYSYVAQDLEKIKDAIAHSLGRLMSITTTDVEIKLQTLDGVTISSIRGLPNLDGRKHGIIQAPDLCAGEQKNFIVYLDVPEGQQKYLMTVRASYKLPKIRKVDTIQLNDSVLVVFRPKVMMSTPQDDTACPDVAAELIRFRLMELAASVVRSKVNLEELQRSWEEIKGSRDGSNSPQSVVLALDEDVAAMQRTNDKMFMYSWLTSHYFQVPTTKESPSKSSAFVFKAMEEMIKKMDAEQKPWFESTSSDDEVAVAESRGDVASKLVHFDGPLAITGHDLWCAPTMKIGKSTYGSVYKVTLKDGSLLVVKRLKENFTKSNKEFEAEATVLGKIRHPNLLAFRAYYLELEPKGEKFLIFDYMPKKSLSACLHGCDRKTRGDWPTRMKIAKGTARGLAYLHDDMSIIHFNLTSRNVLLDEQCNPKIADFDLVRLMTAAANCSVLSAAYLLGYRAPELSMVEEANAKTDVYNLGLIILELLTGKPAAYRTKGMDLPQWVASIVEEWNSKVFDPELMREAAAVTVGDELTDTLKLALQCVDPSPSVRPEAREVLQQLEQISQSEEGHVPLPAGGDDRSAESSGNVRGNLVHFDKQLAFKADALPGASRVIMGKSTYGTVYRVILDYGSRVVVKVLRQKITKGDKMFEAEAAVLGKIQHPNLLALRAYNLELKPEGEMVLIFDYMTRGSLYAYLHGRGRDTRLDWRTRITIARGTAHGLAYLHDYMSIIHFNLTASNVLLDAQYNPKIADSGLFRLMTAAANCSVLSAAYVRGYRAPELSKVEEANKKTDVYSLGVIILELLTGKSAANRTNGIDLPQWVASMIEEERTSKVFDRELRRDAAEEDLTDTLKLALQCVDPSPSVRPEAREVMRQLEEIRKLVHNKIIKNKTIEQIRVRQGRSSRRKTSRRIASIVLKWTTNG